MTYYKYKAREGITDWGKIGENLSEGLMKVENERVAKRAEIDENLREVTKQLQDAPYGENITANDWILKGANQGTQHLLALNKALKSGNISLADYTTQTNAIQDGFGSLFNVLDGYNDEYSKYMEMANKGESSALMDYVMKDLDSYTDFGNTGVLISPTDGTVMLTKKDAQGNLSTNPGDRLSVQSLEKRVKSKFNKVDVAGSVETIAKSLAKQFEMTGSGNIAVLDDIRQNPNFTKAKEGYVKSMVPSPYMAASVLTDYVGGGYYFTPNESDRKDPKAIFLKKANSGLPEPVLTEAQQKVVYDQLSSTLDAALDREIELTVAKTSSSSNSGGDAPTTDWNKSKIASNEKITWSPVALKADGEVSTKRNSPIDVVAKADISASSTRADKTSSLQLMVHPQESDGVVITKPTQMQVKVQSYYQARDGGWYALGDVQKDVTPASAGVDEPRQMKTVNVVVPLDKENYNALNAHYNDGTFEFSKWLNSQGAAQQTTQTTNKTTATGGTIR